MIKDTKYIKEKVRKQKTETSTVKEKRETKIQI